MNATTQTLRAEFRTHVCHLSYDNASVAEVMSALRGAAAEYITPAGWVALAKSFRMPCRRCCGTGKFITMVENGQPRGPGGECFRCCGTGMQGSTDGARNAAHDRHFISRAAF